MDEYLGKKVKNGVFWTFLERIGSKAGLFILQLVLARILIPEDYGLCALLLAFINIATVFVNSGLNTALVQNKDTRLVDYSSVFYVSFVLALTFYIILYISAPIIASFFNDERIVLLLRVLSLTLLIGAFNSVQIALLMKKMLFKKMFLGNLFAILISAVVSIFLAFQGFGVWAIVCQYLINRVVVTLSLLYLVRWFPRFEFSLERIKILWTFGWKCMMTNFLSTVVTDFYTTVVGARFPKKQLGEYDTGNRIPATISETFTSSLGAVLFPAFTTIQNDELKLKSYVQKANKISTFVMFPLMFSIAAMAEPIIRIVLTDKWILAVPFLQMACVLYAFYPVHIANIQAINAIGRSDVTLKVEIQKKVVDLLFLAIMISFGIHWIALGRVLSSIIALWLNMRPNSSFLNYSFHEQLKDVFPAFVVSVSMSVVVFLVNYYTCFGSIVTLLMQLLLGVGLYVLLSFVFNRELLLSSFKTLTNLK